MSSRNGAEDRTCDVGDRATCWRLRRDNVLDVAGGLEFCRGDGGGIGWCFGLRLEFLLRGVLL
jgi:hypothetical protein